MSEQIREQVSAFLDGELPSTEAELLLKRLTRDADLRESFGRYALIGEALRGGSPTLLTHGFASRVNLTIDGDALPAAGLVARRHAPRWWRPLAGAAVVAGVAAVAIVGMQQRSLAPMHQAPGAPHAAQTALNVAVPAAATEAISYTVPAAMNAPAVPNGRLTNYMFAHSKYSYGLAQRGVLADLLINDDESAAPASPAKQVTAPAAP